MAETVVAYFFQPVFSLVLSFLLSLPCDFLKPFPFLCEVKSAFSYSDSLLPSSQPFYLGVLLFLSLIYSVSNVHPGPSAGARM